MKQNFAANTIKQNCPIWPARQLTCFDDTDQAQVTHHTKARNKIQTAHAYSKSRRNPQDG